MIWRHTCAIPDVKTPCRECEAEAVARAEPAECPEGAIGIFNSDGHGGCPCRQTGQHHVHRCMHGTEWWKKPPTEDASGPVAPGEGGGTGAGERETHGGSQGAMDAAIEAAAKALYDNDSLWPDLGPGQRDAPMRRAEAAVRAAEPLLRQALAEEIALAIEQYGVQRTAIEAIAVAYADAAEIAREVGRGN